MAFEVGDRVVAESESTERAARFGTIRNVLRGDPSPRYDFVKDTAPTEIYTPSAGALHAAREGVQAAG